ncbi:MAG: DUF4834 family protein [Bacteroidales bacterium]|nr:DUF4834 family protein [Bacteroidales bacterium]
MLLLFYESSLPGVFKVLLIILCIYFLYNLFIRVFLPILLKQSIKSFHQKFGNQNEWRQNQASQKKEGEITIETHEKPVQKKSSKDDEYIDYEEVK